MTPDKDNYISCHRQRDGSLTSLAEEWRMKHMTWSQLLGILQSMEKAQHTSMDQPVELTASDGSVYGLDVMESLSTGAVYFTSAIVELDDAEA